MTKICSVCGIDKSFDDYNIDKSRKDGLRAICKACLSEQFYKNKSNIQARIRPPENAIAREKRRERERLYRKKDRIKKYAKYLVFKAIQRGDLTKRPCEICGAIDVQAHHDDYSKPLDVIWLCRRHHIDLHSELRRKKRLAL